MEDEGAVDVLTVGRALENLGSAARGLDMAYLAELAESTPGISNIKAYAEIVRERATLRQLISAANRIAEAAFSPRGGRVRSSSMRRAGSFPNRRGAAQGRGPQDARALLKQAVDRIDRLVASKSAITGLPTGFADLDGMTSGLQASDLVIVAGRPSMGKTSFAMNLAEHALMLDGAGPVLVFSMEMPADALMMRMLSSLGRINQSHMRTGQLTDDDWPRPDLHHGAAAGSPSLYRRHPGPVPHGTSGPGSACGPGTRKPGRDRGGLSSAHASAGKQRKPHRRDLGNFSISKGPS